MTHFFDPQNKFWRFMDKLFNSMLMGLLWFVGCLPIVTVGASTTALYQYTLRETNDTEGGILRSYFRFFRERFKKATVIWLIQLGLGLFLACDLWFCWQMIDWSAGINLPNIVFVALVSITLMYLGTCAYLYPILALFDFDVKKVITNSFIMAMGNLFVTVTLGVVFVIVLLGCYFLTPFSPFVVGLGTLLSSYFIMPVFNRYAVDDEASAEEGEADPDREDGAV